MATKKSKKSKKAKKVTKSKTVKRKVTTLPGWDGGYTIRYADNAKAEPVIMDGVNPNPNGFTLAKLPSQHALGGADTYLCEVPGNRANSFWKNIVFVQTGIEALEAITFKDTNNTLIGPTYPSNTFQNKANRDGLVAGARITAATERLVGAVVVNGKPEYVSLYRISKCLKRSSGSGRDDVVIVQLYDPANAYNQPSQSGWGYGTRP